ncbi:MAG: hypothetical protein Q9187_003137 [Circinaria calcarea]
MPPKSRNAFLSTQPEPLRLHYLDYPPPPTSPSSSPKGTILLLHGYPQTSYQFRHVLEPLASHGYRLIVPDYRGAGFSSRPRDGYTKSVMASDIFTLLTEHLGIREKVHVVGHDIGGIIAHAYAARYPEHTASLTWGECPLPGTKAFEEVKNTPDMWHFTFHAQTDLPEALVAGRERIYLQHFFTCEAVNPTAISTEDLEHYTVQFAQAGAMRAGFDLYRAFPTDAEENRKWVEEKGKCKVPCLALSGAESPLKEIAGDMAAEMYEDFQVAEAAGSGHYVAEEAPEEFVRLVVEFVEKHPAG